MFILTLFYKTLVTRVLCQSLNKSSLILFELLSLWSSTKETETVWTFEWSKRDPFPARKFLTKDTLFHSEGIDYKNLDSSNTTENLQAQNLIMAAKNFNT